MIRLCSTRCAPPTLRHPLWIPPDQSSVKLSTRHLATSPLRYEGGDSRLKEAVDREISDDYARIRTDYRIPKHPLVLAHGLLGFSTLKVRYLPPLYYWHGITNALRALSIPVITASVPPTSSIADRAAKLLSDIETQAEQLGCDEVNIVAHSMGGLDARYMISRLERKRVKIASLVTIATPHRGSALADYLLSGAGAVRIERVYGILQRAGLSTEAFSQLTRKYMINEFNPDTPNIPGVQYFSYGAVTEPPGLLSPFRASCKIIGAEEGPNDGLVSVESSRWGAYKGTLVGVSHLDLINWSNRVRWTVRQWMGMERRFNAVAFYLDIADMLAREGL